jgi:hypothetical protein
MCGLSPLDVTPGTGENEGEAFWFLLLTDNSSAQGARSRTADAEFVKRGRKQSPRDARSGTSWVTRQDTTAQAFARRRMLYLNELSRAGEVILVIAAAGRQAYRECREVKVVLESGISDESSGHSKSQHRSFQWAASGRERGLLWSSYSIPKKENS